jgi:hypothetical protein
MVHAASGMNHEQNYVETRAAHGREAAMGAG